LLRKNSSKLPWKKYFLNRPKVNNFAAVSIVSIKHKNR